MEKLEKSGVYYAENREDHSQYIVNIEGKAPMLRITNVINIDKFVNNQLQTEDEVKSASSKITNNVDKYNFTPFECIITKAKPKKKCSQPLYKSLIEKREAFKALIIAGKDEEVIISISADENVDLTKAKEILKDFKESIKDELIYC